MKKITITKAIALLCVFLFYGCSILSPFVEKDTYDGAMEIALPSSRSDILDVITDVGIYMKYEVAELNREVGYIELTQHEPLIKTIFSGRNYYRFIRVISTEEGTNLKVAFGVRGHFGSGTQKEGLRIFSEFKQNLLEKLQET